MGERLTSRDERNILLKHTQRRESTLFIEKNLLLRSLIKNI